MEVLLIEDYPAVGYVGQAVKVKNGFARNYLIPKGIAVEIGSRRGNYFKHLLDGANARKQKLKSEAEELGKKIASQLLSFEMNLGSQGKSFGSVTAKDVLEKLNQQGYLFERKQLRLPDSIKAPGKYVATLQLHSEVLVEVPLSVTAAAAKLEDEPAAENQDGKRKRKPRRGAESEAATKEEVIDEGSTV